LANEFEAFHEILHIVNVVDGWVAYSIFASIIDGEDYYN
jgi:hypothetical protein